MFYCSASELPDKYTVLYSYKYQLPYDVRESIREADFVIVHPSLGYVVVEVKQGDIAYRNNQWCEYKGGDYIPMHKDPVEQALHTMYAILDFYKKETRQKHFPLKFRFALCFPECARVAGIIPKTLKETSIWVYSDLENLEDRITALFNQGEQKVPVDSYQSNAVQILLQKILAPSFNLFSKLEDKIEMFHRTSEKILTDEQERILEETEEDKRKIFLGSAAKNYHDFIYHTLRQAGFDIKEPESPEERNLFFKETLPNLAFDYYSNIDDNLKFDAIIVDEGQDFKEEWLLCLENMLKPNGHFYIFADLNQDIFGNGISSIKNMEMSKHKLTINIRNTEKIAAWFAPLAGNPKTRIKLPGGIPVSVFNWERREEERRLIEKEVGRLVSQGLSPNRIIILSPNIKEKSSLNGVNKIKEWPLIDLKEDEGYGIKFSTIRSFKGLEADVVFLIGIMDNNKACTPQDIYVGASRARFLLYVFGEKQVLSKITGSHR